MNLYDLSHTISTTCPIFPGSPPVQIYDAASYPKDAYHETVLTFGSHTSTHVDAPLHVIENGASLNDFPLDHFVGQALVLNCYGHKEIPLDILLPYKTHWHTLDFFLFNTGWSKKWGHLDYFSYPVLSESLVQTLAAIAPKAIGLDTLSPDPLHSSKLPNHHTLLSNSVLIIENLALDALPPSCIEFKFGAFPLAYDHADGAPVRAVAWQT